MHFLCFLMYFLFLSNIMRISEVGQIKSILERNTCVKAGAKLYAIRDDSRSKKKIILLSNWHEY